MVDLIRRVILTMCSSPSSHLTRLEQKKRMSSGRKMEFQATDKVSKKLKF